MLWKSYLNKAFYEQNSRPERTNREKKITIIMRRERSNREKTNYNTD